MRIHVTEPIHANGMKILYDSGAEVITWEDAHVRDLSKAHGVIVRAATVSKEMLENAPDLRVIGKHGVGVDAIDVDTAYALGKTVVFTPQGNMESVAELAVGFMLSASRHLARADAQLRAGAYDRISPKELVGVELRGKTLGLIGMGRIGQLVASTCRLGFSMQVLAYDPYFPQEKYAEHGITSVSTMEELLQQADYINISVPLTKDTAHCINASRLSLCKPNAILVNTARGGVVEEDALYEALKNGTIRAAASDVFAVEPVAAQHPLLSLPNFTATPHIGASTEESLIRVGESVASDVIRILRGQAPLFPFR